MKPVWACAAVMCAIALHRQEQSNASREVRATAFVLVDPEGREVGRLAWSAVDKGTWKGEAVRLQLGGSTWRYAFDCSVSNSNELGRIGELEGSAAEVVVKRSGTKQSIRCFMNEKEGTEIQLINSEGNAVTRMGASQTGFASMSAEATNDVGTFRASLGNSKEPWTGQITGAGGITNTSTLFLQDREQFTELRSDGRIVTTPILRRK